MPSPRCLRIKHRLLLRPLCFFLPTYLLRLTIRLQCAFFTFSRDIPLQYLGTLSLSISFFPCLFLIYALRFIETTPLASAMPKKKSPEGFLQRAREKGYNINRAIVNGTVVKNPFSPRPRRITHGYWTCGIGRSTVLSPCPFLEKPVYLILFYLQQIRIKPP